MNINPPDGTYGKPAPVNEDKTTPSAVAHSRLADEREDSTAIQPIAEQSAEQREH